MATGQVMHAVPDEATTDKRALPRVMWMLEQEEKDILHKRDNKNNN